MTYEQEIEQGRVREAVWAAISGNPAFKDAAKGLALLYSWHGFDMINVVAAENEVRRALYAANLEAHLVGCERAHANHPDDCNGAYPDGHVLRQVMSAAGIVGDWFFTPMLNICKSESMDQFQ